MQTRRKEADLRSVASGRTEGGPPPQRVDLVRLCPPQRVDLVLLCPPQRVDPRKRLEGAPEDQGQTAGGKTKNQRSANEWHVSQLEI